MKTALKLVTCLTLILLAITAVTLLVIKHFHVIAGVFDSLKAYAPGQAGRIRREGVQDACCVGYQPGDATEEDFLG